MGRFSTLLFFACLLTPKLLGQSPVLEIDLVTRPGQHFLILGWENDTDAKYEIYSTTSISATHWEKIAEIPPLDVPRRSYDLPIQNGRLAQFVYIKKVASGDGGEVPMSAENPFTIPELDLKMMPIPAGTFVMGSPDDEQDRQEDEGPQTTVTISNPFWLGKTEVTQVQWQTVMGNNPGHFKGDDRPVERVSWNDTVAFCEKLNEMKRDTLPAGYHYTLPTEAQWEYACRAGTTTRFYYGDDPGYNQLGMYAWYVANSFEMTHPVGEKLPNDWGLHDMHGNVWEWCLDWFSDSYPGGNLSDPQGPPSGWNRVFRGGGWVLQTRSCRSADRVWGAPTGTSIRLGFRVGLSSVPSE
ncbi:MAG: formylglycine-generating enzyme family protein [Verrucomicrobiota bacterium]|nr:formylglycine-generating enzyme family protein [Verrucomicrobiota bacterium]